MQLSNRVVVILIGVAAIVAGAFIFSSRRAEAPRPDAGQLAVRPVPITPSQSRSAPEPPSRSTQGQLAQALAARLGLGTGLDEDRAIGLLASRGIMPSAGWNKSARANSDVLSEVQKAFQIQLTQVANDLQMQVPPTLNLFIFEKERRGGQTFQLGAADMTALLPGRGTVPADTLRRAQTQAVAVDAPHPFPAGDDRLPPVWTYRLRHPGAAFIRVHFATIDLSPPTHLRIVDRYGEERWRYIGGEPRTADVWATAVEGDTAIIALHGGAVPSGAGLKIDKYEYAMPTGR